MNWLAHCWLADETRTSVCGQFLGDWVKGRDLSCFDPAIARGIRLHRAIDRISDAQPEYHALKQQLSPEIRRYAPILADIGFDYALARHWSCYSDNALSEYALSAERRIVADWPVAAPFPATRITGLSHILAGYSSQDGIKRALAGVERRLSRPAPLIAAFSELQALTHVFDAGLASLLTRVRQLAVDENHRLPVGGQTFSPKA